MKVLKNLEPQKVFDYFEEICTIPHGSGNCEAISNYLVEFAKNHHLKWQQDELFNVIMIKEASEGYEDVPAIIIQGHMDMVAVKEPECDINLEKDALKLQVKDDFISAEGTTLGGDDGIAVAYALAILDDDSLKHPRIEVIITTEEEVGMEGATALDPSICVGRRLLNIDSEEEGILLTSCAGGCRAHAEIPVERESKTGTVYEISFTKMLGGHSGTEIDKEHGNAVKFLARTLFDLKKDVDYALISMSGGEKDNAIACDSKAQIIVSASEEEKLQETFKRIQQIFKTEYATKEPDMEITLVQKEKDVTIDALTKEAQNRAVHYLFALPNGIQHMSIDIPGLVETSLNLGIMRLEGNTLTTDTSIRSSIETAKKELMDKVAVICHFAGGEISYHGEYPGWQYNPDSKMRKDMIALYEEMFGTTPKVEALHAGLECGIFSQKLEGLDCISFGPDIFDIHTTQERLKISSVKRMWDYIVRYIALK